MEDYGWSSFLDEDEKRDIAEELQTTVEDLYMPRSEEKYHALQVV